MGQLFGARLAQDWPSRPRPPRRVARVFPAWATVVISLGGAVIGFGSTVLLLWHQRVQRRAGQASARLERAAEVLGPSRRLLIELNPSRMLANFGPDSLNDWRELRARWDGLNDRLLTVEATQPSREVGELLKELSVEATNATISTGWALRDMATAGQPAPQMLEATKRDHANAWRLLGSRSRRCAGRSGPSREACLRRVWPRLRGHPAAPDRCERHQPAHDAATRSTSSYSWRSAEPGENARGGASCAPGRATESARSGSAPATRTPGRRR
jgi:hypothetical protein